MDRPNFARLSKDQIWAWIETKKKSLSPEAFDRLLESCEKELADRMEQLDALKEEVGKLYSECSDFDDGVSLYFDVSSDKMLEKKARVLKRLLKGDTPEEIGKDYFDILEGFDQSKVKEGTAVKVGDWEFDPEKYK